MRGSDSERQTKQQAQSTVSILNIARFVSPLGMFAVLYWMLGSFFEFNKAVVLGLSFVFALGDYLALTWLVNIFTGKNNKIG